MPHAPHPAAGPATLIRAHRDAQADHRAALAAEHDRDLAAARTRLAAIDTRLRALGHAPLADQLTRETHAGTALIIALTCSAEPVHDQNTNELGAAMAAFARTRAGVDAASRHRPAAG